MVITRTIHVDETPSVDLSEVWEHRDSITLIDVRSPGEFKSGSIPGAINFPIFDNEERAVIGTLWKRMGHDRALNKGYQFLDESFDSLLESVKALPSEHPIYVYCAKGGLRSKMACNALRLGGLNPTQVIGGYRGFRQFSENVFEHFGTNARRVILLSGLAGSGKTLTLHQLDNMIDLEGCAQHSGSAFGHIAVEPVTTKQFEANLVDQISRLDLNKPVYIEAESRRIGLNSIPKPVWDRMYSADLVELKASLEVRVSRMVDLYVHSDARSQKELLDATQLVKPYFSHALYDFLLNSLADGDYRGYWEVMLTKHYDSKYKHLVKGRRVLFEVETDNPAVAADLITQRERELSL